MICDWFADNMPWLVQHVGGAPLAVQLILAFALLAALVLGHNGACAVLSASHTRRPRRAGRFNWLARWRVLCSDDEPYQDWMDEALWREVDDV